MIINNGMFECDQLLIVHFKSEYQRINEMYKNLFDIQIGDCYPYTLNGILTDFWEVWQEKTCEKNVKKREKNVKKTWKKVKKSEIKRDDCAKYFTIHSDNKIDIFIWLNFAILL